MKDRREANKDNQVASSAIFRFLEAQKMESGQKFDTSTGLDYIPANVTTIPVAEQGRRLVFKEISLRLSKIRDASLDDFQLRALNDEINALIKDKRAWDFRIRQLGGFKARVDERFEDVGTGGPMGEDYYYFGRAKELPEVKAWLARRDAERRGLDSEAIALMTSPEAQAKGVADRLAQRWLSRITPAYYGLHGAVEEGLLLDEEQVYAEERAPSSPVDWLGDAMSVIPVTNGEIADCPFSDVPTQAQLSALLHRKTHKHLRPT